MEYQNIYIIASFILLYSLFAKRMDKTILSGPLLAVIFGVLVGPVVFDILVFESESLDYKLIAELALALVLFTDASNTNLKTLKNTIKIPVRLLLIGLPLTVLLGVFSGYFLFEDFSWIELAILATMLAPTDAALGKAVVVNPKVPQKIKAALNVESGLNDGICVPLLFLFIAIFNISTSGENVTFLSGLHIFIEEIGIGLAVGLGITYIIDALSNYAYKKSWISDSWETVIVILLAISCFTLAQAIGGSGFIACFTGGLLYGMNKKSYKNKLLEAAEGMGDTISIITWIIFGTVVISGHIRSFSFEIILYSILSLTLIRMIPVVLSLTKTDTTFQEKLFMGWFGPRGLASIVFAIIVLEIDLPNKSTIILTVICTILLSVILHGLTAKPFINRLKSGEISAEK